MKKKILIIGITGQDGSYLAKLFLNKKFIVHGTSRQKGDWAKNVKYLDISNKIKIYQADKKFNNLNKILSNNYDYIEMRRLLIEAIPEYEPVIEISDNLYIN